MTRPVFYFCEQIDLLHASQHFSCEETTLEFLPYDESPFSPDVMTVPRQTR